MRHVKRITKNLLIGMICAGVFIAISDVLFGCRWLGAERALFVIGGTLGIIIGEFRGKHTFFNI